MPGLRTRLSCSSVELSWITSEFLIDYNLLTDGHLANKCNQVNFFLWLAGVPGETFFVFPSFSRDYFLLGEGGPVMSGRGGGDPSQRWAVTPSSGSRTACWLGVTFSAGRDAVQKHYM